MKIMNIKSGDMPKVGVLLKKAKELGWDLDKDGRTESSCKSSRVYLWNESKDYGMFIDQDELFFICGCNNCGHEFTIDEEYLELHYKNVLHWVNSCLKDGCSVCSKTIAGIKVRDSRRILFDRKKLKI